ncbi:MAG TPA: TVP38/TMEM64 family protein [Candidatus Binataceae bacterium]|nr:TVP38/TMEM64 family protein [Candidatus Binataceae bacterium]
MAAIGPVQTPAIKPDAPGGRLTNVLRIVVLLLLVGGSAYIVIAHREWIDDPRLLKAQVVSWGIWGPIIYMLLYAVGPSFLVPGAAMTIAAGLAFGVTWGSVWSLIGADIGAVVAFGAGRFLGKAFVERTMGQRFHNLLDRLARGGFYITLYLRLVPVIPYNAFNLLAGASPIRFSDYFWASVIGMVPGTILFALLGDALWHPTSPRFFIALGLIAMCFVLGEIYRRWKAVPLD